MSRPWSALIPRLRALLATGFMAAESNQADAAWLRPLAHPLDTLTPGPSPASAGGAPSGWIISQHLLALRPQLNSEAEWVCALLALQAEVRAAWLAIAAARCQEAGQMTDAAPLVDLVSGLGRAAAWVMAALPDATLDPSPHATLERELLGMSLEQAAATPALVRVLAVAAQLARFDDALPALPTVDASGADARRNWGKGRLLALPVTADQNPALADEVLLHGQFGDALPANPSPASGREESVMNWVMAHPWPLLLAMVVFAQDAWKAESRGGLLLELPAGQNAFAPAEIAVSVIGVEGDEVRCGSLADLLLRTLASLGVACFPYQPTAAELNAQLTPLVGLLLQHSVWRYQDGASSQLGQYQIHPRFSDQCYSLPASRVFNRTGKLLWQTIRLTAERWRQARPRVSMDG